MRRSEGPAAGPGYPRSHSRMGLPGWERASWETFCLWAVIGAGLWLPEKSEQGSHLAWSQLGKGEVVEGGPSQGHLSAHQSGGGIPHGCYFQRRTEKSKNGKSASSRHHPHTFPTTVAHVCTLKQSWGCRSTPSKTYHCGRRRELVREPGLGPQPCPLKSWGGPVSPPLTLEPWHWGRLHSGCASPASGRGRPPASAGNGG